jgi:hypothetical protein
MNVRQRYQKAITTWENAELEHEGNRLADQITNERNTLIKSSLRTRLIIVIQECKKRKLAPVLMA